MPWYVCNQSSINQSVSKYFPSYLKNALLIFMKNMKLNFFAIMMMPLLICLNPTTITSLDAWTLVFIQGMFVRNMVKGLRSWIDNNCIGFILKPVIFNRKSKKGERKNRKASKSLGAGDVVSLLQALYLLRRLGSGSG